MTLPLSCYIVSVNEEDCIARALMSVRDIASETLVVDSGSHDATIDIATAYGAKVLHHPFEGIGPQKRFAQDACRYDWVLNLDADEWLSEELQREILHLFAKGEPERFFYELRRIDNIYPMDDFPRLWVKHHYRVRLYHRHRGAPSLHQVHEHIEVGEHKVGNLKNPVMHRSVRHFEHLMAKWNAYSSQQAFQGKKRFYPLLMLRLFTEPMTSFMRAYIRDRHFTGGLWGVAYSLMESAHHFTRMAKMIEHKQGWDTLPQNRVTSVDACRHMKKRKKLPISCFIITYNEEDRIHWPLQALRDIADDIVVVDAQSTDKTQDVARSYGARVMERAWSGYGEQKCFAEKQCRHNWVFNVDADEWPSEELLDDVEAIMTKPETERASAYKVPLFWCYSGEDKPRPSRKAWNIVRFYDRQKVGFNKSIFAEKVIVPSHIKTDVFKGAYYHYPFLSCRHFWRKYNRSTSLVAPITKPLPILFARLFFELPWCFLRAYVVKGGYRDGLRGYVQSQLHAYVYTMRIIKKLEYRLGWSLSEKNYK